MASPIDNSTVVGIAFTICVSIKYRYTRYFTYPIQKNKIRKEENPPCFCYCHISTEQKKNYFVLEDWRYWMKYKYIIYNTEMTLVIVNNFFSLENMVYMTCISHNIPTIKIIFLILKLKIFSHKKNRKWSVYLTILWLWGNVFYNSNYKIVSVQPYYYILHNRNMFTTWP